MNENEIYTNIAQKIWSIMPKDAITGIYQYEIKQMLGQSSFYWIDCEYNTGYYSLDALPNEVMNSINDDLEELHKIFGKHNNWTQCEFILNDNGAFHMNFAYISEGDSWYGLFMKGISELTSEEAAQYYIPQEIWEERVKIKNSKS